MKKKLTKFEKHNSRQCHSLFRWVSRSFTFRLFIVCTAAFILLAGVNRVEKRIDQQPVCQVGSLSGCLLAEMISLISVANIEAFSIVIAALLFVIERSGNKEQEHLTAWQLIDDATNSGAVVSYARIKALESLNEDAIPLDGIDLQKANLNRISIPGASLKEANLTRVNLAGANLRSANLSRANLSGANLTGATLINANLIGAILINADLSGAELTEVNFTGTDLTGTKLTR